MMIRKARQWNGEQMWLDEWASMAKATGIDRMMSWNSDGTSCRYQVWTSEGRLEMGLGVLPAWVGDWPPTESPLVHVVDRGGFFVHPPGGWTSERLAAVLGCPRWAARRRVFPWWRRWQRLTNRGGVDVQR